GPYQQAMLEAHFHSTEGRETYLGDWHTHPKGAPVPSYTDKCTLARIAEEPRSQISRPIMIILGGSKAEWRLNAIRFLSTETKLMFKIPHITSLKPITYSNTQAE
ncbi:MAG TPA: Mov34/MPN/PAD-1 family protein, partial [Gallionella sp.]